MKIGLLTFGNARRGDADKLAKERAKHPSRLAAWLVKERHQVVEGRRVVGDHLTLRTEAKRVQGCDAVIFACAPWALPDLVAQTAQLLQSPILLWGTPTSPPLGPAAWLAAAGTLEEIGVPFTRVWGESSEKSVLEQVRTFLRFHEPETRRRGAAAAGALFGQHFGEFDGPARGVYTGHLDASQWMEQFGIHVQHHSQAILPSLLHAIPKTRVQAGLEWLERYSGDIRWNRRLLTRGLDGALARQVRLYLALKDFIRSEGLDFCALAGAPELPDSPLSAIGLVTAWLNDVTDGEEKQKRPLICAAEGDANGALTMQLLHLLSDTPVLTGEVRSYHAKPDVYELAPEGRLAPWFSRRSKDFRTNWKQAHLTPASSPYAKVSGASLHFAVDPADPVTFARLTRRSGRYALHFFSGALVKLPTRAVEKLGQPADDGPPVYARFHLPHSHFLHAYRSRHVHAILGDYRGALLAACETLGLEPVML